MKIEIAEHGRMTESGSSLLRLIQNQNIPLLDLLVRESVQNSLDAAKTSSTDVEVNMIVGEFCPRDLNKNLEKIENGLNRRYTASKEKFIAVRDSKTVGLTGPVRYSEVKDNVFGNLLKLVYEICKPQMNEGAGGSWGLGKTIYFRLGIGLVIYYSRIYQRGKYQSRLAACLVEDETRKDALIPYNSGVKRGIAWWGKRDSISSSGTVPVDNEKEIEKILSVFGLSPYSGKDTGTTIIIPYINEKNLLDEVYATNEDVDNRPYWASSINDYLNVALQRWYAPRLFNPSYQYGPYLSASVNGSKLKVSGMLSLFRYIREFYIIAAGGKLSDDSLTCSEGVDYHSESIDLRGVLEKTSSGNFVYAKLNRRQLKMEPPENQKSPLQQIFNTYFQSEGGNGPLITYTRRPGMLVGYDHDGTWTHRMPKSGPDDYIVGLFVANSNNSLKDLKDPRFHKPISLEEYIRQGEKADHASWTDRIISGKSLKIVTNIQRNIIKKVKNQYNEAVSDNYEKHNIGLGHALANILLPAADFGNNATPPSVTRKSGSNNRSGRKSSLHIMGNPVYSDGEIEFEFEIRCTGKPCLISLQVLTDFKRFDADLWEDQSEIGKAFPISFKKFSVEKIQESGKAKKNAVKCDLSVDEQNSTAGNSSVCIENNYSENFSTYSYIRVVPYVKCVFSGHVSFAFTDPELKGTLELKEIDNE